MLLRQEVGNNFIERLVMKVNGWHSLNDLRLGIKVVSSQIEFVDHSDPALEAS